MISFIDVFDTNINDLSNCFSLWYQIPKYFDHCQNKVKVNNSPQGEVEAEIRIDPESQLKKVSLLEHLLVIRNLMVQRWRYLRE